MCKTWFLPSIPLSDCNDGRTCNQMREVYAPLGLLSFSFLLQTPMTLGVIILLGELVVGFVVFVVGGLLLALSVRSWHIARKSKGGLFTLIPIQSPISING
jgi:uncharacterized membrane protein